MVDSRSGRLAGRYELRGLIGRGGMAEVRLGYDLRLSRIVAIKMLRTDLARDSIFQERFRREAHAAASLNHPAIVAVYDTGEETMSTPDGGTVNVPYIVMEYVEGHTVRDLLQEGAPVPINEAVEIVAGVLSALEYSHHEGLVHRDIKPGNIMVTNTGKIKVMDFGIARVLEDSQATMTQTDAVVGTAQYLSPEQAQGEQVDARSDLYSTGCVLFELLTGQPPFKADSAVAVAYQHVSEPPRLPSSIASDISSSLDRVVMRSLAKRKEDRYACAADMRADLMKAVRGEDISPVPDSAFISTRRIDPVTRTTSLPPLPPQTAPVTTAAVPQVPDTADPQRKNTWIAWVLALLAALLVLGGVYLVWASQNGTNTPAPTPEETTEINVTVPELKGQKQDEARATLQALGLELRLAPERQFSNDVPADAVISSDPAAGATAAPGSTVRVTLSKGPEAKAIPDLQGQSIESAQKTLTDLGFTVSVQNVDDPNIDKGRVVSTDPAAGTQITPGATVTVKVASGFVKIPSNLVGKSLPEVTQKLEELGLSVVATPSETTSPDAGIVMSLSPVGTAPIHSQVTVTYAVAPEPVPDPEPNPNPDPKPKPKPKPKPTAENN